MTYFDVALLPLGPYPCEPVNVCIGVCYLAGAQDSGHAVAVSECKLDLDVDPPGSLSREPARPQPVVLTGAHHVTHLIQHNTSVTVIKGLFIAALGLNSLSG